jgi:hypothetical protein
MDVGVVSEDEVLKLTCVAITVREWNTVLELLIPC